MTSASSGATAGRSGRRHGSSRAPGRLHAELSRLWDLARRVEYWLPAALLLTVAATQATLAHAAGLSPWKGGGFGMFASTDSPRMRVVDAQGVDAEGVALPITASSVLSRRGAHALRSLPDESAMHEAATELAASEFVPVNSRLLSALDELRVQGAKVDAHALGLQDAESVYRVRREDDPVLAPGTEQSFEAVRIQVWRVRFDEQALSLWLQPLLPAVESRRD